MKSNCNKNAEYKEKTHNQIVLFSGITWAIKSVAANEENTANVEMVRIKGNPKAKRMITLFIMITSDNNNNK